jgi:hypothetical protein
MLSMSTNLRYLLPCICCRRIVSDLWGDAHGVRRRCANRAWIDRDERTCVWIVRNDRISVWTDRIDPVVVVVVLHVVTLEERQRQEGDTGNEHKRQAILQATFHHASFVGLMMMCKSKKVFVI